MNSPLFPFPSLEILLFGCSALSLAAWLYLMIGHGGFWRGDQRLHQDKHSCKLLPYWPTVIVIVPARNEADVIERSLRSLLEQDYPGKYHIILVDDQSEDGTGEIARQLATQHSAGAHLTVMTANQRPAGWMGKLWALQSGLQMAEKLWPTAPFRYLTDADIVHSKGNLRELVSKAENEQLDLVSLMVQLHCRTAWEKLLIPTFVYFFQKVYPFSKINDPNSQVGGAAGGCMLVRNKALEQAGGIEAIRGEIIDDCALGSRLKKQGKIWVGLTNTEYSIRPYDGLGDIWAMVTRTAYTQLRYSPWLLGQTIIGLLFLYVIPPVVTLTWAFHGHALAGAFATLAWGIMTFTFHPTLRNYSLSPTLGIFLPIAGLYYLGMTLDSARRHWQHLGVQWKGRTGIGCPE